MSKQDMNGVRTPQDLERKYDFASLLGLKKNVEIQAKAIMQINNELNNILNSLLINLKGVIDSQESVSLWFREGVPTLTNEPYKSWTTPSEHEGDIYYDKATGYVYQFLEGNWVRNEDYNLVQAMAITNTELDTQDDFERKIYFNTPSPPYDSGDWWIKEDGTLYICQLGKASGLKYEENDFIISSRYTTTVAIKQNDEITVLKGTVTQISEDYVKITDLATGGSTVIAGENITTGCIKSANYVANVSGMMINLDNGTLYTKNTKIDEEGNVCLTNGAQIIGQKGLKNTYIFQAENYVGYWWDYSDIVSKDNNLLEFVIPEGLTITKAKITLFHFPIYWLVEDVLGNQQYVWGYSRNVKLYKATNLESRQINADYGGEVFANDDTTSYSEISSAFGSSSGFTANVPSSSSHKSQSVKSIDLKSHLKSGTNRFKLETSIAKPSSRALAAAETGFIRAMLEVEGFMTYT